MKTHWKKLTNPNYLGAYALDDAEDLIVTIKSAGMETITGEGGRKDEGTVIHFEDGVKPMICNATNAKTITKVLGSPYIEDWIGGRIALYIEHNISSPQGLVDGLRVRPYVPKEELYCEDCGQVIKASNGKTPKWIANYTRNNYGKTLCASCAAERKKEAELNEAEQQ